ncbi:SusD/RagB family nutrient-binding outer membrane lipoprotein [Dyadobacter jiangsuensis]|uniref:SusD-like starch-binding protein associating with outer membrane n=1 Tax=Dyadobacter jiangsuensis TaxID=1591085 RepID=A0A2P8FX23_9BACT|nr:SusD/RagB family nutrient-binding outer membrane lipoprotein [Dyadobacter jiangsuensis]PSL26264.1 SusD-like starch-binding protein associating with outer membrane [Dyadobacter jiangsuensis]
MKKLIILFLPFLMLTACVDSLDDYNVDTKRPSTAPPVTFFSNALKGLADTLTSPNVNVNNYRLYVQHWTTTTYLDEPRYNVTARIIPESFWRGLYKGVISDLNESRRLINADALLLPATKDVQLAQIEIVEIMTWAALVNTFGNIPYSEAMNPENPLPKYDDAKTIYDALLVRLDAALPKLESKGTPFGGGDLLYKGNIPKWVKFGNSLKLKLAMIIADSDPEKAKKLVAEAAPKVFTSNADKAAFPFISTPPNYNPIAQNMNSLYTSRQDFIPAATIVTPMNELNDPRRPFFFTTLNDKYVGGQYGFLNTYSAFSHVSDKIIDPAFEGLLLDYSEVEFLLAEAVERGFITGSAADHYNKAVTASITYWGGTAAEATAYLAQPKVAYATATGNWKEKIGFQKWIALYNRGWESWVEWRRLDYPKLSPPSGGNVPAGLAIPVRMIYPIVEQTLNGANREAAAGAIGGDLASTKLWWDKF